MRMMAMLCGRPSSHPSLPHHPQTPGAYDPSLPHHPQSPGAYDPYGQFNTYN